MKVTAKEIGIFNISNSRKNREKTAKVLFFLSPNKGIG